MSIIKDYNQATKTHCGVKNLLPSISTAIGDFWPQNLIWKLSICLNSSIRYFLCLIYYHDYCAKNAHSNGKFAKIAFIFHFIELTSLILLSLITSKEYHAGHVFSFIMFLISSTLYMLITTFILTDKDSQSKKIKKNILFVYLISLIISFYFYSRHNLYCEPYVFSLFSLFEYLTVLSNIAYHAVLWIDLKLSNNNSNIVLINSKDN